jgi:hypothetical protein
LADWWHTLPGSLRYAVPGVVAVAVLVVLGQGLLRPTEVATPLAATSPAAPSYSDAEIQQAMADLELALSYLEQVSRRTSTLVREEILTEQLGETFSVSARIRNNDPQTGPDAGIGGPI